MEQAGAQVLVLEGDVSRSDHVAAALARVDEHLEPLRGVVHAAAVLVDHTVLGLSRESLREVLAPKLLGAFNLHLATRGRALDFFALYSSIASLLGSAGQGNYAASNAAIDALAEARRAVGLPATSIQWGPFSEVGLAAAQENRGGRLSQRGLASISLDEGLAALPRLLAHERPVVSFMHFDVRRWLDSYPQAASSPFWSELRKSRPHGKPAGADKGSQRRALAGKTAAEKRALIAEHVREELSRILRISVKRLPLSAPFATLGVDSLMSIELRNRLNDSLDLKLPGTLLFTYTSVEALAEHLLGKIDAEQAPAIEAAPPRAGAPAEDGEPIEDDDLLAAFDASMSDVKLGDLA
jgi:acyl carrier protein